MTPAPQQVAEEETKQANPHVTQTFEFMKNYSMNLSKSNERQMHPFKLDKTKIPQVLPI